MTQFGKFHVSPNTRLGCYRLRLLTTECAELLSRFHPSSLQRTSAEERPTASLSKQNADNTAQRTIVLTNGFADIQRVTDPRRIWLWGLRFDRNTPESQPASSELGYVGISMGHWAVLTLPGSILLCGIAIFVTIFLIFRSERKQAAVGRR